MDTKKPYWTYTKSEFFEKDLRSFMYYLINYNEMNATDFKLVSEGVFNLISAIHTVRRKGGFSKDDEA